MLSNSNIIPEKLPSISCNFFKKHTSISLVSVCPVYGIIVKKKAFAERGVAEKSICF